MTITVTGITIAEAATILNAIISFIHHTLALAIVVILVKLIVSNVHPAITWSVVAHTLHASLWPTLLRADSSHGAAPRVALLSNVGLLSTVLIAVAGVVTPLGLKSGPLVESHNLKAMNAVYVNDTSPLASATSPRSNYFYSRTCGAFDRVACPGSTHPNSTVINPSIIDIFNSTTHGPFTMQYRQHYKRTVGYQNASIIQGQFSTLESFILQDGVFAVEGAIVDLTETPGIGLINHTMPPSLKYGGMWSQEMLWLEPATTCVDTNLTIDYSYGMSQDFYGIDSIRLIDHGGFFNLTTQDMFFYLDGQHVNLYQNAYAGAVFSNMYSMHALGNLTRNQSSIGKAFLLSRSDGISPGAIRTNDLEFLTSPDMFTFLNTSFDPDIICTGYGGGDSVNITNVGVHCGTFLGPPYRTDGGDDRLEHLGSKWRQNLLVCASVTKASIQRVDYSLNGTAELANLNITRAPIEEPVLWAMENTDMKIAELGVLWGRVTDAYEFHPNLITVRARAFIVPASNADVGIDSGLASNVHGLAWGDVYLGLNTGTRSIVDYSGSTNAVLLKKYQSLVSANSTQGVARICNLIWTDILVNYLLSTDTSTVLMVAEYHPSITFDLKYGIPLIMLAVIWLPSFTMALVSFTFGKIKLSQFKNLLNHTSVGRTVTGPSAFNVTRSSNEGGSASFAIVGIPNEKNWADFAGQTLVSYKPRTQDNVEEGDHDQPADTPETSVESRNLIDNSEAK